MHGMSMIDGSPENILSSCTLINILHVIHSWVHKTHWCLCSYVYKAQRIIGSTSDWPNLSYNLLSRVDGAPTCTTQVMSVASKPMPNASVANSNFNLLSIFDMSWAMVFFIYKDNVMANLITVIFWHGISCRYPTKIHVWKLHCWCI